MTTISKNTLIAAMLLTMTALTSCSDFLNREPTNSSDAEDAIATARDAEVAINGIMNKMSASTYYGRNMLLYADAKGGDLTIYANGRGNDNLYTFNHTPTSGTYSGFWSQIYDCVMRCATCAQHPRRLGTTRACYGGENLPADCKRPDRGPEAHG